MGENSPHGPRAHAGIDARLGDIVLDDTSCFRWLRDRHRDSALKNGYVTELVYLEVSLAEVEARMERNGISGSRHLIDANVFEENIRSFEAPQPDEAATVLHNPEDVSRWIESDLVSVSCPQVVARSSQLFLIN